MIVGFENSRVEALEGSAKVVLCVNVTEPANVPIEIEFLLEASTLQRSAGTVDTAIYLASEAIIFILSLSFVQIPMTTLLSVIDFLRNLIRLTADTV